MAGSTDRLHGELRTLIAEARQRTVVAVNTELTRLYWLVGKRLHDEVLGGERAAYGQAVIVSLGGRLAAEFGRGFEAKNLRRMMQFVECFPDAEIVATLSRQLNWSHITALIPLKDSLRRDFYARMAAAEGWSVRELRRRIETKTFERTAIAGAQGAGVEKALTELDQRGVTVPANLARRAGRIPVRVGCDGRMHVAWSLLRPC